jgi:hypothetical protein
MYKAGSMNLSKEEEKSPSHMHFGVFICPISGLGALVFFYLFGFGFFCRVGN